MSFQRSARLDRFPDLDFGHQVLAPHPSTLRPANNLTPPLDGMITTT